MPKVKNTDNSCKVDIESILSTNVVEISTVTLRDVIPLLFLDVYRNVNNINLYWKRRMKDLWFIKPSDWPENVPFVDPNNINILQENGSKQLVRNRLEIMFGFLKEKYLMKKNKSLEQNIIQTEDQISHIVATTIIQQKQDRINLLYANIYVILLIAHNDVILKNIEFIKFAIIDDLYCRALNEKDNKWYAHYIIIESEFEKILSLVSIMKHIMFQHLNICCFRILQYYLTNIRPNIDSTS